MSTTQRRWVCPECGEGKLAPQRPRQNDVRRYCLPCSEKRGTLVERSCPALERERAERTAELDERRKRKERKERDAEAARWTIACRDAAGTERQVHVEKEIRRMARKVGGPLLARRMTVKLRRGNGWNTSGHAKLGLDEIVLTVPHGTSWEHIQVLMLHEVVHLTTRGHHHDRTYRSDYARACPQIWPGIGRVPSRPSARRQYEISERMLRERTLRKAA